MIELLFDHLSAPARLALESEAESQSQSLEACAAQILEDQLLSDQEGSQPVLNGDRQERGSEAALKLICRRLVRKSLVGFYLVQDGQFRYVNDRFGEIAGYEAEEIAGELGPKDLVHPEDWPLVRKNIRRRMEGEVESLQYQFRMCTKDGRVRHVEILGSHVKVAGEPGIAGTLVDVTRREEARRALEFSEHQYERLIEEAPSGIGLLTVGGTFKEANARLCAITGYDREELFELTLNDLQADSCTLDEILPNKDLQGGPVRQECRIQGAEGREVPVEISATLVQDRLAQLIVRDVSKQKEREAELKAAKEEAEEASQMKTAFLANMSHEIRTPITTILGFADVLAGEIPDRYAEFIRAIRQSGERLLETLSEVLDLARIESGETVQRPEEVDLRARADEVADSLRMKADRKNLDLDVCGAKELPARLDRSMTDRVLTNLVENAIKFTEEGTVEVHVVKRKNEAVLRVEDSGIGIDAKEAARLLEPFRQASRGHEREYEGTGLGLTVAHRLTEAMGGTLDLESEPGQGTTVTVQLPRTQNGFPEATTSGLEEAPNWGLDQLPGNQRVLVVDDDAGIRTLIREMLPETFEVDLAATDQTALEQAQEQFYDLVLLDINLTSPDSGVKVMKKMRQMGRYDEALIVAITAYAQPGDGEEFHRAGFDGYVPKPFTKEDLRQGLIQIFEQ